MTPNHLGYAYIANELASYGYIVVSINANRGITAGAGLPDDRGLNLMRGRLILRHLALLSGWNRGTGPIAPPASLGFNPVGSMNFDEVGLMGHSRGGEGTRAALQQFRDQGSPFPALIGKLDIRSIFEIGPVDGQTSRMLDANGVNSIILLPACDGDVSNIQGIKVFDRVFLNTSPDDVLDFHGTTYVYGADHDAYNTEWQTADSPGCNGTNPLFPQAGESRPQQITARDQLIPFFRATVGRQEKLPLAGIFDPLNPAAPTAIDITDIDRGFLPAPLGQTVTLLEKFAGPTGTGDSGKPSTSSGVTVVQQAASSEHQPGTRVATISWDTTSPSTRYFQVNLTSATNVANAESMSFRTALRCFGTICTTPASADGEMSYEVSLVDASGQTSKPISTAGLVRISRPVGSTATNLHSTLYTVQIPLAAVRGVNLRQVTGIRFDFTEKPAGIVDITDIAVLKRDPLTTVRTVRKVAKGLRMEANAAAVAAAPAPRSASADGNSLAVTQHAADARASTATSAQVPSSQIPSAQAPAAQAQTAPSVDIVLTSKRSFPVTNSFPKLTVGDQVIEGGTVSADGMTVTVNVPQATYESLPAGANVTLSVQASTPDWQFGALPK